MRLGNKILTVILGLLILNLAREYILAKEAELPSVAGQFNNINFDIQRKDWDYYNNMFSEGVANC